MAIFNLLALDFNYRMEFRFTFMAVNVFFMKDLLNLTDQTVFDKASRLILVLSQSRCSPVSVSKVCVQSLWS